MKVPPSILQIHCYLTAVLIAAATQAADSPPVPRATPTDAQVVSVLQTATSPANQSEFFQACERAIQEKRVDWLVAAARNPDKRLKLHVLATSERLQRKERCQLWTVLLNEGTWTDVNRGLDTGAKRGLQRIAIAQAEREMDGVANADVGSLAVRQKLRTRFQQASTIPEAVTAKKLQYETEVPKLYREK